MPRSGEDCEDTNSLSGSIIVPGDIELLDSPSRRDVDRQPADEVIYTEPSFSVIRSSAHLNAAAMFGNPMVLVRTIMA